MVAAHSLAAPDRIVEKLEPILKEHAITCHVEDTESRDHGWYVTDVASLICRSANAQISMGIEKRRDRKGVYIVLIPECRSFFRRNYKSQELAQRVAEILCQHGASEQPDARCENLE